MRMRTIFVVACLVGAFMGFAGSATAVNPCNGGVDQDCTCPQGTYLCDKGQKCGVYIHKVCLEGSELNYPQSAPLPVLP